MKKLITLLVCLLSLPVLAQVNALIDLKSATLSAQPYSNRVVKILPMSVPTISSPSVVLRAPIVGTTDSNGRLWVSNLVTGLYAVGVQAPPTLEQFKFLVASNWPTTIGVDTNLVADSTATFPAGSVAYSASVTDLRYSKLGATYGVIPTVSTMTPTTLSQSLAGFCVNNGTGPSAIALTNTLPSASVLGTYFQFVVTAGHAFSIQCSGTDVIQYDAFQSIAGGQLISAGSTGDSATVQCVFPGVWYVVTHEGSDWTIF